MARSAFTPLVATRAGVTETLGAVDAVNGNSFLNLVGDNLLIVKNGGAGALTVTIKIAPTVDGNAVASKTATVAAGAQSIIGPFPAGIYNQVDGSVYVDFSTGTSITAAVLQVI